MRPVLVHQHWWARQKNTTKFILIPVQVADGFLQTTIGLKKKRQPIGPQPTFANPLPSINKHKLTRIIDDMEPSGGRATDGIGTNSGHTGGDNGNGHSSHIHKSSDGRATDGIGTNSSHTAGSDLINSRSGGGRAKKKSSIGLNTEHKNITRNS